MSRHAASEKHAFHVPVDGFAGSNVVFPPEEAQHAARVLRLAAGDVVRVVDGAGGAFRVRLDVVDRRGVIGSVVEALAPPPGPSLRLTLGFGVLKHAGRAETILEKATELGVARLVPLDTERTERATIKASRARAILVAAMKQSGGASLPELADVTGLDAFVAATDGARRFVCHESAPTEASLVRMAAALDASVRDVAVAVGPEGGFTDAEVERLRQAGFTPCSLGPTRLRTETAAIVAAATLLLAHA